jgi:hypothetical protein
MSNSLAAAKKRRAPPQNAPTPPGDMRSTTIPPPSTPSSGLTLPQVIALVDKRLHLLETTVKQLSENRADPLAETSERVNVIPSNITEVLDEFNVRFETMAIEIENLKNIVMSLQSYTMDVNKMLLEERVRILSDNDGLPDAVSSDA